MKWKIIISLFIFVSILLVSSSFASITGSNRVSLNTEAQYTDLPDSSNEIEGYIVELKEEPLIAKKIEIDSSQKETRERSLDYLERSETGFFLFNFYEKWRGENLAEEYVEIKENAPQELIEQTSKLSQEHQLALNEIQNTLGKEVKFINPDAQEGNEFVVGFNGFVLDISESEAATIKRLGSVKEVHPNYKVYTLLDESIPAMSIDLARSYGQLTGEGITIAVIDTGIDPTHESLDDLDDNPSTNDPKIVGWKDYINFEPTPYDDNGHGTHCSGIASGTGGNSSYQGVAPKANLVGVKVLDEWGGGSFSQVIAGIEWTIQNKDIYNISVISMSLGANINSDGTTPVEIAADYAVASGINFVVAAGNAGPSDNTVGIPASAHNVITIGATDKDLNIASFSSRGPTKDGRIKPEISAVGVNVVSSVPTGNCRLCDPSGYKSLSGTSMATPHVAGFVALLLQDNPGLTTTGVKDLLAQTAVDKGEPGPDNTYGYGVLDGLSTLFENNPPQHEISVSKVGLPNYLALNKQYTINAEIENLGLNNENVEVKLSIREMISTQGFTASSWQCFDFEWRGFYNEECKSESQWQSEAEAFCAGRCDEDDNCGVDYIHVYDECIIYTEGNIIDSFSQNIQVSSQEKEQVDFEYQTDTEGEYELTIEAVPVPDETIIDNNELSKQVSAIEVSGEINVAVVDSWGTDKSQYTIFDYLNENWQSHGDYAVTIDYETLNKEDLTYQDLVNSNADVLIISDAWANGHLGMNHEFKDSEIQAIKQYTEEGHGLIGTSGTLSEYVPNNIKLAELFGIKDIIGLWNDFNAYQNDETNVLVNDQILTKDIPNQFSPSWDARKAVVNLQLDNNKEVIKVTEAKGQEDIFTSAFKPQQGASIYFTNLFEIIYANNIEKQLFYNGIVWANQNTGTLEKDIAITDYQIPDKAPLNSESIMSAKVKNNGLSQETVSISLIINGEIRETKQATLNSQEEKEIIFSSLTFSLLGNQEISIEAIPLPSETFTINNKISKIVLVPSVIINSVSDYSLDTNNNGLTDFIVLELGVDVFEEGFYNIQLDLTSFLGVEFDTYHYGDSIGIDDSLITLKFPAGQIKKFELNGPYKIKNLVFNFNGNTLEESEEFHTTNSYSYTDFDDPSRFTREFSDYGLDANGNSLYESLIIEVGIDIQNEGNYLIFAELYGNFWNWLGGSGFSNYLEKGIQNISLIFDGKQIREEEVSGPYDLKYLILFYSDSDDNFLELDKISGVAYQTSPYLYTDFESDECIDTDGFDITVSSFVSEEEIIYNDECVDPQQVREYYCELDIWQNKPIVKSTVMKCENSCSDGACIDQPTESTCSDDDLINDLSTKGEVNFKDITYEDKCEENGLSVREYFCVKGKLRNFVKRCPSGLTCSDGACV